MFGAVRAPVASATAATSKGKYVALAVLLPRVGALRTLELCPSLVEQLVWAVGVRGNVSGQAVSLLLQFLQALGTEVREQLSVWWGVEVGMDGGHTCWLQAGSGDGDRPRSHTFSICWFRRWGWIEVMHAVYRLLQEMGAGGSITFGAACFRLVNTAVPKSGAVYNSRTMVLSHR